MKFKLAAVIEPHPARYKALVAGLSKAGLKVTPAREPEALGREQLVVVGASVGSPSRVARAVRTHAPQAKLLAAQAKGFKAAWADAVLPLPLSVNDLKVRLSEWARPGAPAEAPTPRPGDGILDPATGFYTFAHFKEVLFIEVKRARRYGFPLALALISFDPREGQPEGVAAELMAGLGPSIRRSLRDTDYPVQQSGEKVLLLMPHTDLAGALIVARRICERVARAALTFNDAVVQPTISVGVAAGEPGKEYGFADLVRQAQDGLSQAQARGGNRVEFFDSAEAAAQAESGIPQIPPVI